MFRTRAACRVFTAILAAAILWGIAQGLPDAIDATATMIGAEP